MNSLHGDNGNANLTFSQGLVTNGGIFHVKTTSDLTETFGSRLRRAMRARGIRNQEVADRAGVHVKTVSQWLGDKQVPEAAALNEVASLLHVTSSWLLRGEVDPERNDEGFRYPPPEPERLIVPRVMQGLPYSVRVWLQDFLLEITKAGATEEEVDSARTLLTSPESFTLYVGGKPQDLTEEQVLEGLEAQAHFIRDVLRDRGRKFRR